MINNAEVAGSENKENALAKICIFYDDSIRSVLSLVMMRMRVFWLSFKSARNSIYVTYFLLHIC